MPPVHSILPAEPVFPLERLTRQTGHPREVPEILQIVRMDKGLEQMRILVGLSQIQVRAPLAVDASHPPIRAPSPDEARHGVREGAPAGLAAG